MYNHINIYLKLIKMVIKSLINFVLIFLKPSLNNLYVFQNDLTILIFYFSLDFKMYQDDYKTYLNSIEMLIEDL